MGRQRSNVTTALARHPRITLLIGPAAFLVIYVFALMRGLWLDLPRDSMMQFIGPKELADASYGDLLLLHSQPAGFNAWLKAFDGLGPGTEIAWMLALLVGTLVALWMVGDLTLTLTRSLTWGLAAGLLAAVVPGTLFYTLWVFYTQPAAVLLVILAWGLATGLVRKQAWPLVASVLAMGLLFTVRATFAWPLVLLWVGLVWWLGRDVLNAARPTARRGARPIFVIAAIATIAASLGLQAASYERFGTITQSSWSYENSAKALMTQMSPEEERAAASSDPCLAAVYEVGVFQPIDRYPACATDAASWRLPASPLLDETTWANGTPNMGSGGRLALADQWRTFSINALKANPLLVAKIPFPTIANKERGTLMRFFWPSGWYWIIDANVSKGGLFTSAWLVLFSWVPLVGGLGILIALIRNRRIWRGDADRDPRRSFVTLAAVTLFLTVAYLLLETGENERFRTEIDWLIIALGMTAWWGISALWRERRSTRRGESSDAIGG